ncbi:MAG: type II toxin-antitoxin system VapC family toxin [Leeuwenhoekiella sp.]
MKIFLDTSALVKLYHTEKYSEALESFLTVNTIEAVYLSDLAKVEFASAIFKKLRLKALQESEALAVLNFFSEDSKNFRFVQLNDSIVAKAHYFIEKYGKQGLRSLDAIQLASMISIEQELDYVISFDDLLNSICDLEALKLQNF